MTKKEKTVFQRILNESGRRQIEAYKSGDATRLEYAHKEFCLLVDLMDALEDCSEQGA